MIGIVTALYDEAREIIPSLDYRKTDGIGAYYGVFAGKPVSLYLTRPGIPKKSQFVRWINSHPWESIINIGFAGAAKPWYRNGDILRITEVRDKNGTVFPLPITPEIKNTVLYTSPRTVFLDDDKEDIAARFHAHVIDMEGALFLDLIHRAGFTNPVAIIKIVGDSMGSQNLMEKEISFRSFFSPIPGRWDNFQNKIQIIWETGIINSMRLYRHKRFLQKRYASALEEFLL